MDMGEDVAFFLSAHHQCTDLLAWPDGLRCQTWTGWSTLVLRTKVSRSGWHGAWLAPRYLHIVPSHTHIVPDHLNVRIQWGERSDDLGTFSRYFWQTQHWAGLCIVHTVAHKFPITSPYTFAILLHTRLYFGVCLAKGKCCVYLKPLFTGPWTLG